MSQKQTGAAIDGEQKIDARDVRDGGWYWVQQELLYVFTPLIGRDAAWLYQVMCLLIPQKVENPLMELKVRTIAKAGGYGKSIGSVHRGLEKLIAVGMIEVHRTGYGQTPEFKLVSLRKLAALGHAELKRRLTVPVGNRGEQPAAADQSVRTPSNGSEEGPQGADEEDSSVDVDLRPEKAPGSITQHTVPVGNIVGDAEEQHEEESAAMSLFQKEGGFVPENPGHCSKKADPLRLKKSIPKLNPPTPLKSEGGAIPRNSGGLRQMSDARLAAEYELAAAVAKVRRECNLSEPRLEGVIERALRLESAKTDETPDFNAIAERMIAAQKRYAHYGSLGLLRVTVRVRRFLAEGLWCSDGLWMIDEESLKRRQSASIGMSA